MQDNAPTAKVTAGGLAGIGMTVLILVLNTYVPFFKATPIDGVLSAGLTTLATGAAAYLTKPSRGDVAAVTPKPGGIPPA